VHHDQQCTPDCHGDTDSNHGPHTPCEIGGKVRSVEDDGPPEHAC
jgi:hypothetical protein